jgi:hypothetical protein
MTTRIPTARALVGPATVAGKPTATGTTPKATTPTRLEDSDPLADVVNEPLSK